MLVPRKEYHEWVALFLEGHDSAETPTGAAGGVQEDGLQQGADGKPSAMVLQYLQREGEWGAEEAKEKEEKEKEEGQGEGEEAAEAEPLGNPELAAVLLETLRVSEMPDQKPDLPDLSGEPQHRPSA